MVLLKFVLIFVIIYYLLKSLIKLFFPFLLPQQNQQKQPSFYNRPDSVRQDGEVTILSNDQPEKQNKDFQGGEYVDFEEIED